MNNYSHHPLYHISLLKSKKELFATRKSLKVLRLPSVLIDRVPFQLHSDRTLLVLSKVLLRVFSIRVLFEPPVIGCSSGSSVIDSSFRLYIFKRGSHLTITSDKNEEILAWFRYKILYWKYMSAVVEIVAT